MEAQCVFGLKKGAFDNRANDPLTRFVMAVRRECIRPGVSSPSKRPVGQRKVPELVSTAGPLSWGKVLV